MATVYVDVFRAVPGILVIYILGFGIPASASRACPRTSSSGRVVALTLIYSAYVSEVYRAGIDSVHPSQDAAARSLGLSQVQTMRYVVVPAGRPTGDPAAAQRLHRPPEGHRAGVVHRDRRDLPRSRRSSQAATFNFTPYVATALVFIVVTIPLARLTDWLVARERDASGRARPVRAAR